MRLHLTAALATALLIVAAASCTPAQIDAYRNATPEQQQTIVAELQRQQAQRPAWPSHHPFLTCVRHHESDRGPWPHANGYRAENPYSSASGAYQFIDSTWRNVSARAGHPGWTHAAHAPEHIQDAVALWLYNNGGRSAWTGTGC